MRYTSDILVKATKAQKHSGINKDSYLLIIKFFRLSRFEELQEIS